MASARPTARRRTLPGFPRPRRAPAMAPSPPRRRRAAALVQRPEALPATRLQGGEHPLRPPPFSAAFGHERPAGGGRRGWPRRQARRPRQPRRDARARHPGRARRRRGVGRPRPGYSGARHDRSGRDDDARMPRLSTDAPSRPLSPHRIAERRGIRAGGR
ncbi:MAG TPA: hypothetical protein DIU07_06550 [Rhodobacteraceae bacterium]|nr:hypothetical protein [Paracoccaceae bacterium]